MSARSLRHAAIRAGFEVMAASGLARLAHPLFGGVGLILTLHRVLPPRSDVFQPNRHLEISPRFLKTVLEHLARRGFEIVPLDEAHHRLTAREFGTRFACLTFDDGYRDLRDLAQPMLRSFGAPFTVYVTADYASGISSPWWIALERLIAGSSSIPPVEGVTAKRMFCLDEESKRAAFDLFASVLAKAGDPLLVRRIVTQAHDGHDHEGQDPLTASPGGRDCLNWGELRMLAADPLATVGAHGISHCNLARADAATASREIGESRHVAEAFLGRPVRHFAYPYGDAGSVGPRERADVARYGFATAVTTRPGVLSASDGEGYGPLALPRISLNGLYQSERFLDVLTSGLATAAWSGWRRRS